MNDPPASGPGKFVQSGQMRAIAITTAEPSPGFKGVPTFGQTVPGYEAEVWYAVFGPAAMPGDVLARLNTAIRRVVDTPDFRRRIEPEGVSVAPDTPQELNAFMRTEERRWRKVIVDGHISVE